MIDKNGFRLNIGIVLCNKQGRLLWARRISFHEAWQFPQGGIQPGETPRKALYRELKEELGLLASDVEYIAETKGWLSYRLPNRFIRYCQRPLCIGQKQKWYLLRLMGENNRIRLDYSDHPEFDDWLWVEYWYPMSQVVTFKRAVYRQVLREFEFLV